MMRITAIVFLLLLPVLAKAQYITVDKDGYTNIRKRPITKAKIIDKVLRYELFFYAGEFCGNDSFDLDSIPPGWMAVCKDFNSPIGYIYKKNLLSFESFTRLEPIKQDDPYKLVCANDAVTITLRLKPFVKEEHDIRYEEVNDEKYVRSIDGEYPKGLGVPPELETAKEVTELSIQSLSKTVSLPIGDIKSLFNPQMVVFIGPDGELYVCVGCGDGGEAYSICLSVVNGVIKFVRDTMRC